MALAILLRNAQNGCRLRPAIGIGTKFSKMSYGGFQCLDFLHRKETISSERRIMVVPKFNQVIRQFSVSPVVKSAAGHDHSKIWTYEKYLSMGLLGICPLGIMYPNVLFDILMAVSMVMHMHWGFEAIAIDYVRPVLFGNIIPKIALGLVYLLSIFTLVGLFNLTFNNSGIGNGIRLLWKI